MVHLQDIALARYRIAPYLKPTPLEPSPALGESVWVKLENRNITRSFKVRGAVNALLALDSTARSHGLIAASSGNHAQALAFAASRVGAQARILMPTLTPQRKVNGVRTYGGEAVLIGSNYDETEAEARRQERADNLTFVSPYNDAHVIAGAGTIGLELLDELPNIERVIVPASGCGLISGIGVALKTLRPQVEVIAVNAQSSPALYNFFYGTHHPQVWDTVAEALSGEIEAGSITFELSQRYVDRVVLVPEAAILAAMRWMLLEHGVIAEGGGATGIAALQCGAITADSRPMAVVVTGGNVDEETLRRIVGL